MSLLKADINDTYVSELIKYQQLVSLGTGRSSASGTWISTSSSVSYSYTNETDLMGQLKTALLSYMITASDWNSLLNGSAIYTTTTGTANTYTVATNLGLISYNDGLTLRLKFNISNTSASTINIDSLGVKNIKKFTLAGKVNLNTGDIIANSIYFITYDGTDFILANTTYTGDAGEVKYFAMSTAPTGYLKANGAAISRSTYANLFSAIGTTFGVGDGSTTFNLPDLRGVFPRGWDDGRGYDTGRIFGSYQADDNKAHTHTGTTDSSGSHTHDEAQGTGSPGGPYYGRTTFAGGTSTLSGQINANGAHTHTFTTNSTGATEVTVKNMALLACIKY